jgi:intergrase/recombinase
METLLSYLDKHLKVIAKPLDVAKMFSGLTVGQQHNLSRGLRNVFNFLEAQGWSEQYLDVLRKNVPRDEFGVDLWIPEPADVVASLVSMSKGCLKYQALYNLVLDSGLRLVEACRLLKEFREGEVERFDGFCVVELGYFRKSKLAYFGFFTDFTLSLIEQVSEEVDWEAAVTYIRKCRNLVRFKYLRKFAFDTMTSDELNIPESVADFIQGRTPKSVGARHYMKLKRKAIQFYPRYAEYVKTLRTLV